MAVPPPHPSKPALRRTLRAARRRFVETLGAERLAAAQAALHDRLRPLLDRGGPLAGYAAIGDEPDILPLLAEADRQGRTVALPRIGTGRTLSFAPWRPDVALVRGPLGIAQPAAAGAVAPTVLLVPLVGFDRGGARLGQGGGYYDRWFAAHPHATRIGIAWSVQEAADLPVDAWDMPLHAVATERDWIDC